MLHFTDVAKKRVAHFLEVGRAQGVQALRVAGTRADQKLWLVKPDDKRPDDRVIQTEDFEVYLDPVSAANLEGATVDFVEDVMQSGFRVFYPSPTWDDPVAQRVQEVLDQHINPGVASHGGEVTLQKVDGDTAYLLLGGGCQGCGSADVTLKGGIEGAIRQAVPEIRHIVDATDHARGENPYYKPSEAGDSPLADERA